MTGSTEGSTGGPAQQGTRWPARVYGLVVAAAVLAAFAGLPASNFWTDELFTLHVVGHDGGLAEVWRRALTDTHPPLYYVLLYGWTRLGGYSETWMRLPSAVFAVVALAVAWRALRGRFSATAVGFALAVGGLSTFWFEQSQNARGYALATLLAAALLALAVSIDDAWRLRRRVAWGQVVALLAVGLVGSFVHSYLLLCTGMVIGMLLLAVPCWRARVILALGGVAILAANAAYAWLLLQSTTQDVHGLWFDTGWRFFWSQTRIARRDLAVTGCSLALNLLVLAAIVRGLRAGRGALTGRVGTAGNRAALLGLCVLVGMFGAGVLVSYAIAPSYSSRNMLTASPFAWVLLAWLYDAAGPRLGTRGSQWMAAGLCLLVAANVPLLRGRMIERNENWRDSARFVAALPGCTGQDVAVMQPFKFGPATAEYRRLAEHDFYGHYAAPGTSIRSWLPSELAGRRPVPVLQAQLAARAGNAGRPGQCTLLLWAVHDLNDKTAMSMAQDLARQPGVAPARVAMQSFLRGKRSALSWRPVPEGYVFYAVPAATSQAPGDVGPAVAMPAGTLGDRYVVAFEGSEAGTGPSQAPLDRFKVERWSRKGGAPVVTQQDVPRARCLVEPAGSGGHAHAAGKQPACFDLPPG